MSPPRLCAQRGLRAFTRDQEGPNGGRRQHHLQSERLFTVEGHSFRRGCEFPPDALSLKLSLSKFLFILLLIHCIF